MNKRLVQFLLEDDGPVLSHNESILRNGERIGYTASSAYAHTLGACASMGYLQNSEGITSEFLSTGVFEIEQADRLYKAKASLTPMYDPKSVRTRS